MHEETAALGSGIRERLLDLCGTMDERLRGLLDSKHRVSEVVHEIRKSGKSLRGGLALVGMKSGTVRSVRAVGRLLAGQRDAVSRLKTWDRLAWEAGPHAGDPTVLAVGAMLAKLARTAGSRPPEETVGWAVARIAEVRQALAEKSEDGLQAELSHGVRRLRHRVCKRLERLGLKDRDKPAFHDARKAIKAWLGAQALLREPADPEYGKLAEVLGDENDLSALEIWLDARGFTKEMAPVVWQRVDDTHQKLREKILEMRDAAKLC